MFMYGGEYVQQLFSTSVDSRYREIGDNRWVPMESNEHYDQQVERLMRDNDVILMSASLKTKEKKMGAWYKSRETIM